MIIILRLILLREAIQSPLSAMSPMCVSRRQYSISVCTLTTAMREINISRFFLSNWFLFSFYTFHFQLLFMINRSMPRYGWCYSLMSNNYDTLANQLHFFCNWILSLISLPLTLLRILPLISWDLACLELDLIECDSLRMNWAESWEKNNALNGFVMSTLQCALFEGYFSNKKKIKNVRVEKSE